MVICSLTRNGDSSKAKELKAQGVEILQTDINNKEQVKRAFENADIVYAVTNFWDPEIIGKDPNLEVKQGKILADAAKEACVKWYLWSSLPNVASESNGKLKHVLHFNGKYEVEEYVRQIGLPAIYIYVACYMSNFGFLPRVKDDNGNQTLKLPEVEQGTYLDLVDAAADTGALVKAVLEDPEKYHGQRIPVVGERITVKDVAATYSKVTDVPTHINTATKEEFGNNDEICEMWAWFRDFGLYGNTYGPNGEGAVEAAKATGFRGTTFEEFLQKNAK
ncbi:hypothetical protein VKS41_008870 [Umbelopsis sp. WA50703]